MINTIHFAREGADLTVMYHLREEEDAQKTSQLVEAEERKCLLISGFLKDTTFIQEAVELIIDRTAGSTCWSTTQLITSGRKSLRAFRISR